MLICVSTRDLVDMGAICSGDLADDPAELLEATEDMGPFPTGDGVKPPSAPGDANWLLKSMGQAGFCGMPGFHCWLPVKVSLLSEDGVEKMALGEAPLYIMLLMIGDWSRDAS